MRLALAALCCLTIVGENTAMERVKVSNGTMLGKVLRALGYRPMPLNSEVYQVTIEREGWKVHTLVSINSDGGQVWLECKFPPIEKPDEAPPSAWLRLLAENERIGPAHFAFNRDDGRIRLFQALNSVDWTATRLQAAIENFDRTVRRTQWIWREESFRLETLAAPREYVPLDAAAESRKLQGVWRIVTLEMRGQKAPAEQIEALKPTLTFENDLALLQSGDAEKLTRFRLQGAADCPEIDFVDNRRRVEKGIYKIDGDTLVLCFSTPDEQRPTTFATVRDRSHWLLTLRREKPKN